MASIQFKLRLFDKQKQWQNTTVSSLSEKVRGIGQTAFESGFLAPYIHSRVQITRKDWTYSLTLDVENTEYHDNIDANLEAAKTLLTVLSENNVTDGLSIFLSGQGLRFLWPWYVSIKYRQAFTSWIKNFDGIDPTPQLKKSFFRLMGYRGHADQGKVRDQHVYKLTAIHDLWSLSVDEYRALTAGKPNYDQCMEWLDDGIFPAKEMPEEWRYFLDEWKVYSELQKTIWKPNYSRQGTFDQEVMWQQVFHHLDGQGIGYSERHKVDFWFLKLDSCPVCGRSDASPYVTPNGRLKCFHANSCPAGKHGDNGIIGLAPGQWIDGFEHKELEQKQKDYNFKTIEDVRNEMAEKILEPGDKLFRVDPGAGKTHSVLHGLVPQCDQKKIIYTSPTNFLNEEIYDEARRIAGDDIGVYWLQGRNKDNCKKFKDAERAAKKGYSPGLLYCYICQKNSAVPCPYRQQFKTLKNKSGFFIMPHAQIRSFDLDALKFDTLVIDEDPLQSFFERRWVPLDAINKFGIGGFQGDFFERLGAGVNKLYDVGSDDDRKAWAHNRAYTGQPPPNSPWTDSQTIWDIAGIDAAELEALDRHLAGYDQFKDEKKMAWQRRLHNSGVDLIALEWLWDATGDIKKNVSYVRVDLKSKRNPYKFTSTKLSIPDFSGQVIVLDGTGNKPEADALFGRNFELVDGNIDLSTCQKTLIKQGLGKTKCKSLLEPDLKKLMQQAIECLRPTDSKILLATHKIVEGKILGIAQELLPNRTIDSIHFYGNRGINQFKEYDAIICFGAPGTNQTERLDEAMTLFADEADRKTFFQHKADAELLQTIHRIRPVNGNKNIILLSNRWLPELGPLNAETDNRRGTQKTEHLMDKAYVLLSEFYKNFGFVSVEIGYALGIGPFKRKKLIEKVRFQRSSCLIYNLLIDKVNVKNPLSFPEKPELILLKGQNSWVHLIKRVRAAYQAPELQNKIHSNWTAGAGTIDAVKLFAEQFNLKFNPENSREVNPKAHIPEQNVA